MSGELGTTNLLLGVMAGVSVFEALMIIGMWMAGVSAYRKMMALIDRAMALADGLEARQVAPTLHRVNAILDDVKDVTAAVHTTIDRIDDTAARVRTNVRVKTSVLVGLIRGARVAMEGLLASSREPGEANREPRTL